MENLLALLYSEQKRKQSLIIPLSLLKRLFFIMPTLMSRFEYLPAFIGYFLFTTASESEQKELLNMLAIVLNSLSVPLSWTVKDFVLPFVVLPLLHTVSSAPFDTQIKHSCSKLLSKVEVLLYSTQRQHHKDSEQEKRHEDINSFDQNTKGNVGLYALITQAHSLQQWAYEAVASTAGKFS